MALEDSEREAHVLEEDQGGVGGVGTKMVVMELNNETRNVGDTKEKKKNKKSKKRSSYMPKFCFRIEYDATGESFDMEVVDASGSQRPNPTHLIIMVNGLIGRFDSLSQCF